MKKLRKKLKLILGIAIIGIPYFFSSKVLAEDSPQYAVSPQTQALYRYAEDTTEDSFSDCLSSEINTFEYLQFSDNSGPRLSANEIIYEIYLYYVKGENLNEKVRESIKINFRNDCSYMDPIHLLKQGTC